MNESKESRQDHHSMPRVTDPSECSWSLPYLVDDDGNLTPHPLAAINEKPSNVSYPTNGTCTQLQIMQRSQVADVDMKSSSESDSSSESASSSESSCSECEQEIEIDPSLMAVGGVTGHKARKILAQSRSSRRAVRATEKVEVVPVKSANALQRPKNQVEPPKLPMLESRIPMEGEDSTSNKRKLTVSSLPCVALQAPSSQPSSHVEEQFHPASSFNCQSCITLQTELSACQKKVETAQRELESKQHEVEQGNRLLESKIDESRSITIQHMNDKRMLDEARRTVHQLQAEVQQLKTQIEVGIEAMQSQENEMKQIRREKAKMIARFNKTQASLERQIDDERNCGKELSQEKERLHSELLQLRMKLISQSNELSSSQQKLNECQARLQSQSDELKSRNERIETLTQQFNQRVTELSNHLEQLRQAVQEGNEKMIQIKREYDQRQIQMEKDHKQKVTQLEHLIENEQRQLKVKEAAFKDIESFNAEQDRVKEQQIQSLTKANESLAGQVQSLTEANQQLQGQLDLERQTHAALTNHQRPQQQKPLTAIRYTSRDLTMLRSIDQPSHGQVTSLVTGYTPTAAVPSGSVHRPMFKSHQPISRVATAREPNLKSD